MTETLRYFLVGARGSGKTTVGRLLAARLGWRFADTDDLVEANAGRSIRTIFEADGETAFRDLESAALVQAASDGGVVIATGGGIVLRPANRALLRATGLCAWLAGPPELLCGRVSTDSTSTARRPALTTLPALEEMRQVLTARESLYREVAHIVIDTSNRSPDDVVSAILASCSTS